MKDMTASITNSISMCSSYTEGSAGEVQEKTTTSKTTSSPSTYSDNEKDFLIDDDYKVKNPVLYALDVTYSRPISKQLKKNSSFPTVIKAR